jgi:SAM-dependent methyltransferase
MHDQARRGYGTAGAAAAYERGRPGYPEDAVAELVRVLGVAPGATVLDLAAGTGKLTRQLMATGATLVAVEPVAAMRDQLARLAAGKVLGGAEPANPADGPGGGLSVLGGTAEAIPLRDGSLDAVTVGQAFHWFDAGRAVAELGRVLRPAGRLGLIWNARDESRPWVAEIGAILDRHASDAPRYRDGRWRAAFDAPTASRPSATGPSTTCTTWTGRRCWTGSPRSASSPPSRTRPGPACWTRSAGSSTPSRPRPARTGSGCPTAPTSTGASDAAAEARRHRAPYALRELLDRIRPRDATRRRSTRWCRCRRPGTATAGGSWPA